ncbi:MAG TPA: glutamate-1-semialdehyde 2,1-aminomutase [bacterium]|jgi:glutamate-1-semialdehyde 2,1-aminomutase|nr:glutamate-1-semialdehyde 2,1-aminomutase [bacterium]
MSASSRILGDSARFFPGGVNSPVRAFRAVGGPPVVAREGHGSIVIDADGRRYVDYVGSWGALILGHAHPDVVSAVSSAAARGTSFGMPTASEADLARLIIQSVPSMERIRLVNSGTEAAMSALRLTRAFTGRSKIIKFAGCYHGHADLLLAQAGSGLATLGLPASGGVPPSAVADTLVLPYNDLSSVETAFAEHAGAIAAVIVEPVAANMGVVRPRPGFLSGLRDLTVQDGALLVFDEVITGFRLGAGGAQSRYGVRPDLTCLGKIIGGGLPIGAYGGRADIMDLLAPNGPVYQAGTLSGNPVAASAGIATLQRLADGRPYDALEQTAAALADGLAHAAASAGVRARAVREASMLTVFFTGTEPADFAEAQRADTRAFARFFHAMLRRGVLLPPSQFEAWFVSTAHSAADVEHTVTVAAAAFREAQAA